MTWLVRYAGVLITFFHVGKDCKTAYNRRKGKDTHPYLVEFAEKVLFKPLTNRHNKLNKLDERFEDGVFLGIS